MKHFFGFFLHSSSRFYREGASLSLLLHRFRGAVPQSLERLVLYIRGHTPTTCIIRVRARVGGCLFSKTGYKADFLIFFLERKFGDLEGIPVQTISLHSLSPSQRESARGKQRAKTDQFTACRKGRSSSRRAPSAPSAQRGPRRRSGGRRPVATRRSCRSRGRRGPRRSSRSTECRCR